MLYELVFYIGCFQIFKWLYQLWYWYYVVDRDGNTGRYKHWEHEEGHE